MAQLEQDEFQEFIIHQKADIYSEDFINAIMGLTCGNPEERPSTENAISAFTNLLGKLLAINN
jgi:hypothetical protein